VRGTFLATSPRLPVALSEKNHGLSALLTDTLRLVRSGHVGPTLDCPGGEPGSPRAAEAGRRHYAMRAMFSLNLKRAPASHLSSD
jgi:hypothetical protein